MCLAVLQPTSLSVFRVAEVAASTDASPVAPSPFLQLVALHAHAFVATAGPTFVGFNLCSGAFGAGGGGAAAGGSSRLLQQQRALFTAPGPASVAAAAPPCDAICVQSEDGVLAFYEQERYLFTRTLNDCSFPGPLAYLPAADAIVTATGDMSLEAYTVASLTVASAPAPLAAGGDGGSGRLVGGTPAVARKPAKPDWRANVGEHPTFIFTTGNAQRSLQPARAAPAAPVPVIPADLGGLLVVGRRWLVNVPVKSAVAAVSTVAASVSAVTSIGGGGGDGGGGGLLDMSPSTTSTASSQPPYRRHHYQRRLDQTPVAACIIPRPGAANGGPGSPELGEPTGLLLATEDRRLLVFGGPGGLDAPTLLWASSLPFVPLAVAVGSYDGTSGLITMLAPDGGVAVVYCGTEPPQAGGVGSGLSAADVAARDVDYAAIDTEHRALLQRIREVQREAKAAEGVASSVAGSSGAAPTSTWLAAPAVAAPAADVNPPAAVSIEVRSVARRLQQLATTGVPASGVMELRGMSEGGGGGSDADDAYFDDDDFVQVVGAGGNIGGGDDGGGGVLGGGSSSESAFGRSTSSGGAFSHSLPRPTATITATLIVSLVLHCSENVRGNVTLTVDPPPWALLPKQRRLVVLTPSSSSSSSTSSGGRGVTSPTPCETRVTITLPFRAAVPSAYHSNISIADGVSGGGIPWSTRVDVAATYTGGRGDVRVCRGHVHLPLCLAMRVVPPIRDAGPAAAAAVTGSGLAVPAVPRLFKLTLDTNRPAPPLSTLFADLMDQPSDVLPPSVLARIAPTAAHALSFEYTASVGACSSGSGGTSERDRGVTILVSKAGGAAGGRYRIQAYNLPALHLIVAALVRRLAAHFHGGAPHIASAPLAPSSSHPSSPIAAVGGAPHWVDAVCEGGATSAASHAGYLPAEVPPTDTPARRVDQQLQQQQLSSTGQPTAPASSATSLRTTTSGTVTLASPTSAPDAAGDAATAAPRPSARAVVPVLSADAPAFAVAFLEPLPLADVFAAINAHWAARHALGAALAAVDDRATEYRLLMKRLLGRFRDSRAPAPLGGLDLLLERVQANTAAATATASAAQAAAGASASALACTLGLLLSLLKYRFALSPPGVDALRRALSPAALGWGAAGWGGCGGVGEGGGGQGWEEVADCGLVHLLRGMDADWGEGG